MRLEKFKIKSQIRESIYRSQDRIEKIEQEIQQLKSDLAVMEADPTGEQWCIDRLRSSIAGLEAGLAKMRANHARFVEKQKKPSPAFQSGIRV